MVVDDGGDAKMNEKLEEWVEAKDLKRKMGRAKETREMVGSDEV